MIIRRRVDWWIATLLTACLGLECHLAASFPGRNHSLLGGWIVSSVHAAAEVRYVSEDSIRESKMMNQTPKTIRMRAFRVSDNRHGNYSKWIVLEDLEIGQFALGPHSGFGGVPTRGMKATFDREDAWSVLNSLRNALRLRDDPAIQLQVVADSIDTAISQGETRKQEIFDWGLRGKTPSWALKERGPGGKTIEQTITATEGKVPSEEEFQRLEKEVWDFAGGKRLKWKPIGRTAAGRKCEVLTFEGSEEVLVSPTSLEIPTQPKSSATRPK